MLNIGDAGEHVGEPGLRIDIVQLGGLDECVHESGAFRPALRSREQPGFAAEGDAAQRPLGGLLVRQARPSSRKRVNAGQRVGM